MTASGPKAFASSVYARLRSLQRRAANRLDTPVLVLIYHRVTTLEDDPQLLSVTPENFRAHVRFLAENFRVVRLEDDWSGLSAPAVAITFDDGYADNFLEALPILQEAGVTATFYVTTGVVGTGEGFWWDELQALLLGPGPRPERLVLESSGARRVWPTSTRAGREACYADVHRWMLCLDVSARRRAFEELGAWLGAPPPRRPADLPLDGEQLRALASSPLVTVGAHTVNHPRLSSLTGSAQRDEIAASKEQLEGWLGRAVEVFSYPFGASADYNRASVRICKELGFKKAASNVPGQVHRWTDPWQLPRHLVRNWDLERFVERVSKFWVS